MSLYPYIFEDFSSRPSRILDQHFGLGFDPEDLLAPLTVHNYLLKRPYFRPWRAQSSQGDTGSTVNIDKDKFQVTLDVQQFAPNEITVKATGKNTITVEGKHEEKQDEHGFISRHFVRRYIIPDGHDIDKVVSNLSSDGVLSIMAPRRDVETGDRHIEIVQTGIPVKQGKTEPNQIKEAEMKEGGH